ncbi:methionine adenosyltransferase [Desulfuromonas sp. AOP6]|uniref:methionine adenosyltransferase n=1 Tax=Desulfuromonas sp. AOP6 TaxID=1566351 RepID=UPI0012716B72|nr:methionine adenosyltransferase [Desulfuromonas sp. AOP6]BCA80821.1 S-adenosylmethionine synthetase [Desulfuromonas sp. AOP6]
MRLVVEELPVAIMDRRPMEIVERKGLGHPDSICDAAMDAVSVALCQAYRERFGVILHHNVDKGLLVAGRTRKWFGGGRVQRPMDLYIGDRATLAYGGDRIPVKEIATEAARQWFRTHLPAVEVDRHLRCRVVLAPGSDELTGIFSRPSEILAANDTSAAVGFYPLSRTEQLVLALENHLNGQDFKQHFPDTGEDVKIMAVRRGEELDLTVAMPLLAPYVASEKDYFRRKEEIGAELDRFVSALTHEMAVHLYFNALDQAGKGEQGTYLSLLGTSAEDADSGQVGRGNRVNGLISVGRPLGTEAVAGKNPVSHVGKIYNVLAHRVARRLVEKVDGIQEAAVYLVSRIGSPINDPKMAALQLILAAGYGLAEVSEPAAEILQAELDDISSLCEKLALGHYPVC